MNRCPSLAELPLPPSGKTGWPWTEESCQLPEAIPALSEANGPDGSPWPRISIVTPSYNQGQFIEETIRSVLLQGYPNFEFIVIDGGSTDESIQIIRKYSPWLKYWISEPDRGQSHAINKGLKYCSGDIFNWINSDDLLVPGALHAVAMAWRRTPHVIIAGRVINFNEEGNEDLILPNAITLENFVNKGKAIENFMMWHQPGTFLPREEISGIGGVNEDLRFTMDHFLMIDLLQFCDVVYVPDILARFRLHNSSKTMMYGFLQFGLERIKKLRTMEDLAPYVTTQELKREQVSVLLACADWERSKARYGSARHWYAEAVAVSPSLTIVGLLRRGVFGRLLRMVKCRAKNLFEMLAPGSS